jgi:hypothetical protein
MESFFRPVVDRLTGLLKEQMNLANKESGKRNGTINVGWLTRRRDHATNGN